MWVPSLNEFRVVLKDNVDWSRGKKVAELRDEESQGWNSTIVQYIFEEQTTKAILKLEWPINPKEDKLCQMGTCTSSFSVGSCYRKEANLKAEDTNNSFWQKLWKLEIHDQIKIFLWKVTANVTLLEMPQIEELVELMFAARFVGMSWRQGYTCSKIVLLLRFWCLRASGTSGWKLNKWRTSKS